MYQSRFASAMNTSASVVIEARSAHGAIRALPAARMRAECLTARADTMLFTENGLPNYQLTVNM